MLKNLTQFYHPATIEEACVLMAAKDGKNAVLAGGTHLANVADISIEGLVDLHGLGLTYIRRTDVGYSIGAMTPVQDIFKTSVFTGPAGDLVRTAAGKIGSTLLRNSITIGGNLVGVFPWSDLPPALLAVDATALCRRGIPKRTVDVKNLLETHPKNFLDPSEIVVEIQFPEYGKGTGTAFRKLAKTANDFSMMTIAVRLTLNAELISEARIALNGITKRPQRRMEAENLLLNNVPTIELFEAVARKSLENLEFCADFRASREYRQEVLGVLVRRCLEEALQKARS